MKQKFIDYYMNIAELTSTLSYARRLKVGAVIVKNNQIIGTGYNGMPAGWDNNCEITISESLDPDSRTITSSQLVTKQEVLHAEMNCLMKVAQSTESSKGSMLFTTTAPCIECAKAIYQAGVDTVIYKAVYRSNDGLDFLRKCNIKLTQYRESQSKDYSDTGS